MKAESKGPGADGAAPRAKQDDIQEQGPDNTPAVKKQAKANGSAAAPVLAAALAYADRGWHLFPCDTKEKKSYKSAEHSNGAKWGMTKDAAQIRKDWSKPKWRNAGIGIPTGEINGIFVVDIDTKAGHGVDGASSLNKLEVQYGPLPLTLQAQSPSGSIHYYFKHPGKGIKIKGSTSELGPGIDICGDGQMVVAPPSVRKDGTYTWIREQVIADPAPWLLNLVVEEPRQQRQTTTSDAEVSDIKLEAAVEAIPNPDLGWEEWNRIGMAIWAATNGSSFGRELFDRFSHKSAKYKAKNVDAKWKQITGCPPDQVGVGTLFYMADEESPEWRIAVDDAEYAEIERREAEAAANAPAIDAEMMKQLSPNGNAQGPGPTPVEPQAPATKPKVTVVAVKGVAKPPTLAELTHSMSDLRTMTFDPLQFVVPNYIVEGLTILGGKPKIGKSWLGLEAAIAVAMTSTCLGQKCEQGDVLGLFLEDSKRRLQRRMTVMLGAQSSEWPKRFTYATAWPRMSQGGLTLIREWIKSVKRPRLIIIDILQKFRDLAKGRRQQATQYEGEYSALSTLQAITTEIPGLGILVLHHQRKQGADDPIDTLSGTLGVGGAIDTFCILEKDTLGMRLYGRGRDLEEFDVSVERDDKCRWKVLGPRMVDAPATAERAKIIEALAKASEPMHMKDIAKAIGREVESIKMLLGRMCIAGDIESVAFRSGLYRLPNAQAPQTEIPF